MIDHALIEWLKHSHLHQSFELPATKQRLKLIVEHSLVGLVYPALSPSHPFKKVLKSAFYQYVKQAEQHAHLKTHFTTLFQHRGCVVQWLKGTLYKELYLLSSHRPMGDMDFYLPKNQEVHVKDVMLQESWRLYAKNTYHWVYQHREQPTLFIEWHFALIPKGLYPSTHSLYHPELYLTNSNSLYPTFLVLYHLAHAAKHLKSGGFGLLTLIDLAKLDQTYQKDLNHTWLKEEIEAANLTVFASALTEITQAWFAPDISLASCFEPSKLTPFEKTLLENLIITSGQNAKAKDHHPLAIQQVASSETKTNFILKKWLLPKAQMKSMYPRLTRLKIIGLFIAYTARLLILINRFKTPKRLRKSMTMEAFNPNEMEQLMEVLIPLVKE